jgi:hypothetical protein
MCSKDYTGFVTSLVAYEYEQGLGEIKSLSEFIFI